jgi:iron complex outermembrane receptor protein
VQRHRGVELGAETSQGAWTTRASAMLLQARIVGNSAQAGVGPRPTNVPAQSLRLDNFYNVSAVPGLQLQATLSHEGERIVLPDNSVSIPAWNRLDLATRYSQNLSLGKVTWRAGLDNANNQRAWKESPYMFSHAYLFPLAPRTWRLSAQVDL